MATVLDALNMALDRLNARRLMDVICPSCGHTMQEHGEPQGCTAVDYKVAARSIALGTQPFCGCLVTDEERTSDGN